MNGLFLLEILADQIMRGRGLEKGTERGKEIKIITIGTIIKTKVQGMKEEGISQMITIAIEAMIITAVIESASTVVRLGLVEMAAMTASISGGAKRCKQHGGQLWREEHGLPKKLRAAGGQRNWEIKGGGRWLSLLNVHGVRF
ncbi:hypothetical protein ACLOJK_036697 [Asimina triloba]